MKASRNIYIETLFLPNSIASSSMSLWVDKCNCCWKFHWICLLLEASRSQIEFRTTAACCCSVNSRKQISGKIIFEFHDLVEIINVSISLLSREQVHECKWESAWACGNFSPIITLEKVVVKGAVYIFMFRQFMFFCKKNKIIHHWIEWNAKIEVEREMKNRWNLFP